MSYFITIEGIDGAGKSTLRGKLGELSNQLDKELVITREPGATSLGQIIRNILLDREAKALSSIAELMLFAADRAQHIEEIIRPALNRGAVVICDRFIHSTIAYQGYGRGLNIEKLIQLNTFTTSGLSPDLVLLLDIDPKLGLERAAKRVRRASGSYDVSQLREFHRQQPDTEWNHFEDQAIDFHTRIRNGFLELAQNPQNRFCVIDANQDMDKVTESAINAIKSLLATGSSATGSSAK